MKVSSICRENKYSNVVKTPYIRIANKQLKKSGFRIGDKFNIKYESNKVILTKEI